MNWLNNKGDEIKNRFVIGFQDNGLLERLLLTACLKLDKVLKMVRECKLGY